jgi:arginine N-succinyltransferase
MADSESIALRPGQTFVRPAAAGDLDALMDLASIAGEGMTNLPHDRDALLAKIDWSERSLQRDVQEPDDEYYLLVMDDGSGRIVGTACLYSRLGAHWPFYSYKVSRVAHVSRDLGRSFSTKVLHLVNDFDGVSEVGGLFLRPDARQGGAGALLARSRYMFIAAHRARFGECVVADLRGWTQDGASPFWQAVARPFFGGDFHQADLHNALHGNQFIADLMPRYPIYVTMLPPPAQAAIGRAHLDSEPARRLLEAEGFVHDGYCDIFDGGPTLCARTEAIRTVAQCRRADNGAMDVLVSDHARRIAADGRRSAFRAWFA